MTGQSNSGGTDRLAEALAFTAEDLAANRAGRLSQRQAEWLRRQERRAGRIVILFTLGMAAVPAIALIIFALGRNMPMIGMSVFLLVGLPLLGYWVADNERRKWRRDRETGVAASVYGQVTAGGQPPRYLRIENLQFALTPKKLAAFEMGAAYSIYYTPRTRVILSAERPPD